MVRASPSTPANGRTRRPTATSQFGVSRRESHDASEFYRRFPVPAVDQHDDDVRRPNAVDAIWLGDARFMDDVGDIADGSVALVVTSPPYYAGKEYETAVGEGHVPDSYLSYLDMLRDVFAECARKLEPGGRIAVNVANLGRKPYRSLSSDVIGILEGLGLLLRGEVIWQKARGAGGNCAWGSFQRPGNPVLRDLTERIVVASRSRFDRAITARKRAAAGLPSTATIGADEFMDFTTDVWEFPPESATRVGHPAPFPVELPRRLIDLYTYEGDLVLDPFMGSGSTALAAVHTGRRFVGFDTDPAYVRQARARVAAERSRLAEAAESGPAATPVRIPAVRPRATDEADRGHGAGTAGGAGAEGGPGAAGTAGGAGSAEVAGDGAGKGDSDVVQRRAARDGRTAKDLARMALAEAGFDDIAQDVKVGPGVDVAFAGRDQRGDLWYLDVVGAFSTQRPGLRRIDTLWRVLGKASVVRAMAPDVPLVLLAADVPPPNSPADRVLAQVRGVGEHTTVRDVIDLREPGLVRRLRDHARGLTTPPPAAGPTRAGPGRRGNRRVPPGRDLRMF